MAALSNSWWQISSTVDNEVEEMVIVVTVLHCWSNTVNSFRIASCGVLPDHSSDSMHSHDLMLHTDFSNAVVSSLKQVERTVQL